MAGKPLWSEIDGEAWLDNPRRRRRRKGSRKGTRARARTIRKRSRRGPPKGFKSWRAYMASIRPKGRKRGKGTSMARRKRSRGRRRFRRNQPFRIGGRGGIVGKTVAAARNAGAVVVGKAIARGVPRLINLPTTGIVGIAVQALAGIFLVPIIGRMTGRVFGPGAEQFMLAGALLAPVESLLAGLPVIGPLLGDTDDVLAAIPGDLGPSDLISGDGEDMLAMGAYVEQGMSGYLSPVF